MARPAAMPRKARATENCRGGTGRARTPRLPQARIVTRLGDPSAPKAVSLIAIHQHGIPDHFPTR